MKFQGRVWKFGDNIDTDIIIPARFLIGSDREELARHCFADFRPDFIKKVQKGDILVAGKNFGSGSSREHAPLAIKEAGISVVVAKSFARIFYRNAFNIALPILECEEAVDGSHEGDHLLLDLIRGEIMNNSSGKKFLARPIPDFMGEIIQAGGLVEYIKKQVMKA